MSSSFKGVDYFGSGPHRFVVGKQGRRVVSLSTVAGDPTLSGSFEVGDRELRVEVRGRLVAQSEAGLWALRDALTLQAAFEVTGGTLVDHHGHEWEDVVLLTVEWAGAATRGRVWSVGYSAVFGALEA